MPKLFNSPITQETSPQASGMPLPTWRVKLSNGAVYGPIELGELRTWAEECRIAPGDQVSSDNVNWVNVETLSELAMQWMVEMASGEIFGPVHLHAVIDFVHSRLVIPNSRLVNRVTGEAATVADLVLPLIPDAAKDEFLAGTPVVAEDATSSAVDRVEQEREPDRLPSDQHKEKLQLRIEQLQATVNESESRIKQLQGDLDAQQAQTLKLRDDKAALEKTYLVKLGDVQKNNNVAANALEKAEAQVRALRDDQVRREKELVDRISALSGQTQDVAGQIAEKNNVISRLEAELIKTRGDFEAGVRDLQDRLGRMTSDYDSTLNNLQEKESSLSAAVRELEQARQSAQALTERYAARVKELDVQIGERTAQKQISERELEIRQNEIERLNAALAEKEEHWANTARDWDSIRSEKDSRLQTLTQQIEVLTADKTAMQSALEQNRAELEQARQSAQALTERYAARVKELDVQIGERTAQKQTSERELETRQNEIERLNAALAEKEEHWANTARDWDSIRSEKDGRLQTLTQQIEVLTADKTAMQSALEQNRAELEQARQETRDREQTLFTREKELNERISDLNGQIQNVSENLAAREKEVADQRERIEVMLGEHLQKETQLQTRIEELTGRLNALNQELEAVRGELTRREADLKGMSERVISMENSVTEAGNEVKQQKVRCQGLQEQLDQKEKEAADNRDLFEHVLMAELTRRDTELSQEESALQAVQAAFSSKQQSYLKQIADIKKYIKGDLVDCRESYLRQQKTLESAAGLKAELEQQRTVSAELQERGRQAERALTQRLEKAQEECRDLQCQMGATVTRAESLDKEQQDIRNVIRSKDEEFQRCEMLWVTEKAKLDQEHTALQQRLAESEKVAEAMRVELRERELDHQAALKESQDGIDETMHKAQAADMERDKIRQDLDQLRSLFQERQSADKEREREIAELQHLNEALVDIRRQEEARFQEARERQQREMETKAALVNAKDKELGELKQTLNGETEARQAIVEKLAQMEKAFAEAQNTTHQLKDKMAQDQATAQDFRERTQLEHNELNLRLDAILMERRELESRLASATEALEKQEILLGDGKKQTALREEEWQQQMEQGRRECATLSKRLEQASKDLDQTSQMHAESIKGAQLKMEELQRTTVQLQQEYQGASMRFEQQKKFYEEERGLRRQKEQELHQQRKNCQEVEGSLRQKEQVIIQQKRQFDEELSRVRQRAGTMVKLTEQAQPDGRTSVVKPVVTAPAANLTVVDREPLTANAPNHGVTNPELIGSPRLPQADLLAKADKSRSSIGVKSSANGLPTREPPSDGRISATVAPVSRPEARVAGDSLPSVDPEDTGESARPDKLSKVLSKRKTKLSSSGLKIHNIIS